MPAPTPLARALRKALSEVADPTRAAGAQAYMKSKMPFLGVSMPKLRAVCKEVFPRFPITTAAGFRRDALALFRGARHREERYCAIEWTGDRRARDFQNLDALPMYEEMIVTGAWWDLVDSIATQRLRTLLDRYPQQMRKTMLVWSRCDDMWKRRSAILCQVGRKERTDRELLYRCIEPSLASKEFFLRKAIGWALRHYAWTDPEEVRRYVRENEAKLSPLSKREALKNAG
jgi:3-methyladenine DNA glycosylase AlkD